VASANLLQYCENDSNGLIRCYTPTNQTEQQMYQQQSYYDTQWVDHTFIPLGETAVLLAIAVALITAARIAYLFVMKQIDPKKSR
jgi:hypothetical protein